MIIYIIIIIIIFLPHVRLAARRRGIDNTIAARYPVRVHIILILTCALLSRLGQFFPHKISRGYLNYGPIDYCMGIRTYPRHRTTHAFIRLVQTSYFHVHTFVCVYICICICMYVYWRTRIRDFQLGEAINLDYQGW